MDRFPGNAHPYESLESARARAGALSTNKVLKNTYLLLSATLGFSAVTAGLGMAIGMGPINPFLMLIVYFGLLFAVNRTSQSAWGLVWTFALTGFLGLTIGPIISMYLKVLPNGGEVVTMAFGITAATFLGLSTYVVKSKRDFSFMGSFLVAGVLAAFLLGIVAMLFHLSTLSLVVSGMFVILMAGMMLYQTSEIVRGGETNYILATITLYVSIYNMFLSLLQILGVVSGDD